MRTSHFFVLLLLLTQLTWADRWPPTTLEVLSQGKIVDSVLLENALEEWDGSNPYLLLTLKDGTRGVFRSEDEPWGSAAEVAGFQLDQLLGTDLVPPTVSRTLDRKELGENWPWKSDTRPGSLQLFVEGAKPTELDNLNKLDLANSEILGFVTGRYDNHKGNLLQTPDGRAVMIDFEGALDFQKVRYGDFPFIRRGGWAESPLNVSSDQPFPFDSPRKLVDPSLEAIQETFGPWWGQYWAQGMKGLHGLLRGIPERTIPYVIWDNRLWVQVKVQSRHPIRVEYFPPETMRALGALKKEQLEQIFTAPFRPSHIGGIQERSHQLLRIHHESD